MVSKLLPSLAGWVEIEAVILRSSFHRRPSWRRRVCEYVEMVSMGIVKALLEEAVWLRSSQAQGVAVLRSG